MTADANMFLTIATHPDSWFEKSRALRVCARSLLRCEPEPTPLGQVDYLLTAKMLYGMALESALKGRIVRDKPEGVLLRTTVDGLGALQETVVQELGPRGDGHDLVALARAIGFLDDNDEQRVEILKDLTQCVRWLGRYAIPKRTAQTDADWGVTPMTYGGASISQALDPMLDELLPEE